MRVLSLLALFAAASSYAAEAFAPATVTIPVVGAVNGFTSTYSTATRVTNRTALPQRVRVDWIARDGVGSRENALTLQLEPNETRLIRDSATFAGPAPHLGAVKFVAVDAAGAPVGGVIEASAIITATRRPDFARLTQPVPGVPDADMRHDSDAGMVFYPVELRGFRLNGPRANIGFVNDSSVPNTFEVEIRFSLNSTPPPPYARFAFNVTVPAHGMVQQPLPSSGGPADETLAMLIIRRLSEGTGAWTTYVSSVDDLTGDAVFIPALPRGGHITASPF